MKSKFLFIASAAVLLLAFVSLGIGWKGKANVSLASPISSTIVQFCGAAHGWWALGGIAAILVAIILFVAALVKLVARTAVRG
jgi:hypothetical protein